MHACLLAETNCERVRGALEAFYASGDRILVGKKRLSFPVVRAQLLWHCRFYQNATENGTQPMDHIFTEHDIEPDDVAFHKAWLVANGLECLGLGTVLRSPYLDYLMFAATLELKQGEVLVWQMRDLEAKIKYQREKVNMLREEGKRQAERRWDERAKQHAMNTANDFLLFYEANPAAPYMPLSPKQHAQLTPAIRKRLLGMGIGVKRLADDKVGLCHRTSARKRPAAEGSLESAAKRAKISSNSSSLIQ